MGTGGSKQQNDKAAAAKAHANATAAPNANASSAPNAAPVPGWTGPPPRRVKIALYDLMPELAPGASGTASASAAAAGDAPTPGVSAAGAAAGAPAAAAAVVSATEARARAVFCEQLRAHGYAVITLDARVSDALVAYRDAGAEFLCLPYEHKARWAPHQPDALLRELGSVPNEGYVFTPKLNKEYVKLKPQMVTAQHFPDRDGTPEHALQLRTKFHALHNPLHAIARKCWLSVAQYRAYHQPRTYDTEHAIAAAAAAAATGAAPATATATATATVSAAAPATAPYMSDDVFAQSLAWADVRSSISVIRYWALNRRDTYLPTAQQIAAAKAVEAARDAAAAALPAPAPAAAAAAAAAAPAPASAADAKAAPAAATGAGADADTKAPATATATAAAAPTAPVAGAAADAKAPVNAAAQAEAAAAAEAEAEAESKAELPAAPSCGALDESVHVPCATHTDTGMLTFIACAPVPGLQIANRFALPKTIEQLKAKAKAKAKANAKAKAKAHAKTEGDAAGDGTEAEADAEAVTYEWLDVEQQPPAGAGAGAGARAGDGLTARPGVDVFVIAGRKCALFAADKAHDNCFAPTVHRVLLPDSTERVSVLYFMDCQK